MIERLPESEGAALGVKVTGKVDLEMEKKWIAEVNEVIEEHGKLKCLVFLGEHASWGLDAGIEDFKWLINHANDLEKIAIVSDSNFWKWYVDLDQPFAKHYKVEEKYFKPEDIDAAWKWIKE